MCPKFELSDVFYFRNPPSNYFFMNLYESISNIFERKGLLDLMNKSWNKFHLNHSVEDRKTVQKEILKNIPRKTNGLYIYFLGKKVLYIGKAKNIHGRLLCHYDEACNHPGKNRKWNKFFSNHRDNLTIKWLQLDDKENWKGEVLRRTLESILTLKYKPLFVEFNDDDPIIKPRN
jgi:hypothetical protein